jgi:hypothetical protein
MTWPAAIGRRGGSPRSGRAEGGAVRVVDVVGGRVTVMRWL